MLQKLQAIWNSISVKVLLIITLLVLPLNIIAVKGSSEAMDTTIEQVKNSHQNMLDYAMKDLEVRMYNANSLLQNFTTADENCIRMYQEKEDGYRFQSARLKFLPTLKRMARLTNGADGYFFQTRDVESELCHGSSSEVKTMLNMMAEKRKNETESGKDVLIGWHIYNLENTNYLLYFRSQGSGYCGAWINLDTILKDIEENIEYQQFKIFFSENKEEISPFKDGPILRTDANKIYLHLFLNEPEIVSTISIYQKSAKIITILYLFLIPILYLLLRYLLLNPLQRVNKAHKELRKTEYAYRITDKANSEEWRVAYQSFNAMADELHEYFVEVYERQLEKQKMEIRNLQLQIRPHFLLNTFNLIFTLSQKNENKGIQSIILYLSEYFRYLFRSNKELELFERELHLIQGYIQMIKIRYNGEVEMEEDISPEMMFVRTPPLLIHNFVENAVKYGKKEGQVLHITLSGEYENGWVTVTILDDGNGMSEEQLQMNRAVFCGESEPESPTAHLGLYNSYKRLKVFYGDSATIEVESEEDMGSIFTIRFPYNLEVDDEFIDCE